MIFMRTQTKDKGEMAHLLRIFKTQATARTVEKIYVGRDEQCRCGGCGEGSYLRHSIQKAAFETHLKKMCEFKAEEATSIELVGGNYFNISYGADRALTAYFT